MIEDILTMYLTQVDITLCVNAMYEMAFDSLPNTSTSDLSSQQTTVQKDVGSPTHNYCHDCIIFQSSTNTVYASIEHNRYAI